MVANDDGSTAFHVFHELVRSTINLSVGKHKHRLMPAHPITGLEALLFHGREVVMPLSSLVPHVTNKNLLIGETCGQFLCH